MSNENEQSRKKHTALRLGLVGVVGIAGVSAVTLGKIIIDEFSKQKESVSVQQPDGIMPSATAYANLVTVTRTPESTPIPASTPTTTPTTATNTPETKQDAPCDILPTEYCSQAEVIDWTNPLGQQVKMIGFHLPAGVPLFMPMDGQAAKVTSNGTPVFQGLQVLVLNRDNRNSIYKFYGDFQFDTNLSTIDKRKGEQFGHTQNTGIENAGGYSLLFSIQQGAGKDTTVDEEAMRKMFPLAFAQPAKKVAYSGSVKPGTSYYSMFYDTPPKQ